MPELLEVEYYRRAAERVVGRRIVGIDAPDAWYLRGGIDADTLRAVLVGQPITAARRRGKLLLLDAGRAATLGLRFGMTGRLVVDGTAAIERLEYSSARRDPVWERFALRFAARREDRVGDGRLVVVDPRRLGSVRLDPDEAGLGPDAVGLGLAALRNALGGSRTPLKARLMDQARIAGLGNLLTDEILWRARLAPGREAGLLSAAELRRLQRTIATTLAELDERGGSHTGDLHVARVRGASCPRCGGGLARTQVGGRTTYWCPHEQR
jgi:formamidopyrimidine-DNA glycosylase